MNSSKSEREFFFSQNIPESHKQNMAAGGEGYGSRYCTMPLEDEHSKKQWGGHFQQNSSVLAELGSVKEHKSETPSTFLIRRTIQQTGTSMLWNTMQLLMGPDVDLCLVPGKVVQQTSLSNEPLAKLRRQ